MTGAVVPGLNASALTCGDLRHLDRYIAASRSGVLDTLQFRRDDTLIPQV